MATVVKILDIIEMFMVSAMGLCGFATAIEHSNNHRHSVNKKNLITFASIALAGAVVVVERFEKLAYLDSISKSSNT